MKTKSKVSQKLTVITIIAVFLFGSFFNLEAQQNQNDFLKVKIIGNGFSDFTYIRFLDGATEGFEGNLDAWKMLSMNQDVPMIFTKVGGNAVMVNTFPALGKKTKMDLFTKISVPGNYSIETKIMGPFSSSVKLFLLDNLTGTKFNLRNDSIMFFNLDADSGMVARFQVYFSTPANFSTKDLTCFSDNDGQILIENLETQGWLADISDENNIYQASVSGFSSTYAFTNLHGGNYSVALQDFGGSQTVNAVIGQPFPVLSIFEASTNNVCLCDGGNVSFINNSVGATSYVWDYGDGSQFSGFQNDHTYTQPGEYVVSLSASDGLCSNNSNQLINVVENSQVGINNLNNETGEISVYYSGEKFYLKPNYSSPQNLIVQVYNFLGQKIYSGIFKNVSSVPIPLLINRNPNQLYLFNIKSNKKNISLISY